MIINLGLDAFTPLGYALWCSYFVAIGLTLFQSRPTLPFWVALVSMICTAGSLWLSPGASSGGHTVFNRVLGSVSFWIIATVVWQALRARGNVEQLLWLQESENLLATVLRGEQTLQDIAVHATRALCDRLEAQVGAFYRLEGAQLVLIGGIALRENQTERLPAHAGLLGEVLAQRQPRRVAGIPVTHLPITSTLGHSAPTDLLLLPLLADGRPIGAMELGRLGRPARAHLDLSLLEQSAELIGTALRTATYRQRQAELLEETQRQSDELQTQQEELRVANEELEEQARSLQHSQVSLEAQQAELEQTNVQLEERTQELERQRHALLRAQADMARGAQRLEATSRYKSEFLANMSHELRTPLNSALILAKLLADNKENTLTEQQVNYARAIHASNNDLLALINDILDLSKIEAGHIDLAAEPIEVDAVLQRLRETFEPLCTNKQLTLELSRTPGTPANIVGDFQRLMQILKNLLANAVKFTDMGKVSLRVEATDAERIRYIVCDTGIGIEPDQTQAIFEAFRQADGSTSRKFGGTGLGLSISRDLAQRMGGHISVTSEPGKGSCFTLELPVVFDQASLFETTGLPLAISAPAQFPPERDTKVPTPAAPAVPMPAGSIADDRHAPGRPGRLILVVEDDAGFAQALVALAHELDFDCVVAGTAEEALELTPILSPCGILLDIGLPDVSGLSVLERLKRDPATRHIPVHVVSAQDRNSVAMELGAIGHIAKPATREMLVHAIGQLEDRHRQRMRRLLIVEDDQQLRQNLVLLLDRDQLDIRAVGSVADALAELAHATFDCMVMDLALPDGSGYDLLEHMAHSDAFSFPPVIVYTGRSLTREEEHRLRKYSKSIIVKGARSPERLLDEVTLFLHSVEASLPSDQQRLLQQARQRDAMLDGRTILLAEDDVRNIFALTSVLEPLGVRLEIARNGREALERLRSQDVDLILMDIMMPEMDGLTAIGHIRADPAWAGMPIIALTAKAMADDREQCLRAGANDYIAKPIDVDKLISLCRVWCARR
ncbi:MAG TPA: response regulator [Dyella sp.]